ncbi:hypothetical protein SAMN05428969_1345 [Devosia sp. YR412]|uniref:hypothetical protein n=1 Tax=Devosia sp. YR412 TaxID=1881030 RepID=UPI0008B61493|nr:hypothetical protein [Devosia sp. YR412]SEP97092.1 hypothetical protein SAMN05428969_1345 [Devosia sp. YR412]
MHKSVFIGALLTTTVLGASSAYAGNHGGGGGYHPPIPPVPGVPCTTSYCTDAADFDQRLEGLFKAINLIVDVDDATAIVQEAINAGNLISVGDAEAAAIDLANVHQYGDVYQFALNKLEGDGWASDFTDVTQSATNVLNSISGDVVTAVEQTAEGSQTAKNKIIGTYGSTFVDLEQAATNVVNTVTAGTSKTIEQVAHADQNASNLIIGGWGGYDNIGADVDWDAEDVTYTQAALNAANLISLEKLTGAITQDVSYNPQQALNTAIFHGYDPDVYDFGQSATNVINSVTVGEIDPTIKCTCYDGWEIQQDAYAFQLSKNLLSTMGDVTNTVQSATNIANSISIPTPTP